MCLLFRFLYENISPSFQIEEFAVLTKLQEQAAIAFRFEDAPQTVPFPKRTLTASITTENGSRNKTANFKRKKAKATLIFLKTFDTETAEKITSSEYSWLSFQAN